MVASVRQANQAQLQRKAGREESTKGGSSVMPSDMEEVVGGQPSARPRLDESVGDAAWQEVEGAESNPPWDATAESSEARVEEEEKEVPPSPSQSKKKDIPTPTPATTQTPGGGGSEVAPMKGEELLVVADRAADSAKVRADFEPYCFCLAAPPYLCFVMRRHWLTWVDVLPPGWGRPSGSSS